MDNPQLSARPGRLAAVARRPIVRIMFVILIFLALWSFVANQKPWATVAVVNATGEPLHGVTLVLEDVSGAEHVEQVPVLGPGGRWEHQSPEGLLRIMSLQAEREGEAVSYGGLGEVEAGQVVTLTVDEDGGVRRSLLYLSN